MKKYMYAAVAILIWGTSTTVTKLLIEGVDTMFILCVTAFVASIFIYMELIITGKKKILKSYSIRDYIKMSISGVIGILGTNFFFFYGVDRLPAQEAAVLNYMWPVWIVIFSVIILKEKIKIINVIAIIISIIGMILVILKGDFSTVNLSDPVGVLLILSASICYGLYSVLVKNNTYDRSICTMISYLITFIVTAIYVVLNNCYIALTGIQVIGVMWIGIFIYSIAYIFWAKALDSEVSVKISCFAFISPFISLIMSVFFLGEKIEVWSFIGLLIIILGIIIQNIKLKKRKGESNG